MADDFPIAWQTTTLQPGDLLLLYSDGVTKATNPQQEESRQERLAQVVQDQAGLPVSRLVETLRHERNRSVAGQQLEDDTTIVACKVGNHLSVQNDGALISPKGNSAPAGFWPSPLLRTVSASDSAPAVS